MNLEKIVNKENMPVFCNKTITKKELEFMLVNKIVEIPVVQKSKFKGIILRSKLVNKFNSSKKESIRVDDILEKPDFVLLKSDSDKYLLQKVMSATNRIIPLIDKENNYLGSIKLISIIRILLDEKNTLVKHYERYCQSFGA